MIEQSRETRGRGVTRELATALAVHTTFISQVVNERAAFSSDQALAYCRFFKMSAIETDYFVELVSFGRAGTPRARSYFETRMKQIQKQHADLKSRWSNRSQTLGAEEATYFGSWATQVVHAALQLEKCHTAETIATHLGFPIADVRFALGLLCDMNLVTKKNTPSGARWETTTRFLHLGKESPVIRHFHSQWRQRASQEFLRPMGPEGFHYSGALTFSVDAEPEIRGILIAALDRVMKAIEPSPAEDVYGLNLDLFSLCADR